MSVSNSLLQVVSQSRVGYSPQLTFRAIIISARRCTLSCEANAFRKAMSDALPLFLYQTAGMEDRHTFRGAIMVNEHIPRRPGPLPPRVHR